VKLLARFLGWASILAFPCYLAMRPYQDALASLAMRIFEIAGAPARVEVDLHEPFSLGLYAAMCLASRSAPRHIRMRAVAIGVPALAAFGLLAVLVFVVANRLTTGHAGGNEGAASRFIEATLETVPWVCAPALWLVMVGKWELPQAVLSITPPEGSTTTTPTAAPRAERRKGIPRRPARRE
jgi:hypothetical protein